jgi:hypothetical protein
MVLLLDFDGVLCHSAHETALAAARALAALDGRVVPDAVIQSFPGVCID